MEFDASKVAEGAKPLAQIAAELNAVEAAVQRVNKAINEMPAAARSVKELESAIKGMGTKDFSTGGLAKGLELEQAQFEKFINRRRESIKGYRATTKEFESAPKAAEAVAAFEKFQERRGRAGLGALLNPEVRAGAASAAAASVGPEGIGLVVPAMQVRAVLGPGEVTLIVPADQLKGLATASAEAPVGVGSPAGIPGKTRGKGKSKQGIGASNVPEEELDNELSRIRSEVGGSVKEVVTFADGIGDTISKTYDDVGEMIAETTRTRPGRNLVAEVQHKKQMAMEGFKAARQGMSKLELARLQDAQAAALEGLIRTPIERDAAGNITAGGELTEVGQALGDKGLGRVGERIEGQAKTLRSQANANRTGHAADIDSDHEEAREMNRKRDVEQATRNNEAARLRRERQEAREKASSDAREEERLRYADEASRNIKARKIRRERYEDRSPPVIPPEYPERHPLYEPPKTPKVPKAPATFMDQAGAALKKSFSPQGVALNLINVSGWAAAVTILYKSFELAANAEERLLVIGNQTARLAQIYRGVSSSATQLTNDILALASANGRESEEAMESGIQWARLIHTREELDEAVRVSAMASNVANISMADSTKYLSSIMNVYGFSVNELDGVLGQLVSTSNRYNVSTHDLFDGISKVAAVAKQSGMSFAELQGIIGATVGRTGQTGANIGNALKSIITRFQDPEIMSFLREGFHIETLGGKPGEMKSSAQTLEEIWKVYAKLNDEERRALTTRIAGRTQSARFVGILDSYVTSQTLAIQGALNLGTAEQENNRILATQQAQLKGLAAAWDALVVKQANAPLAAGTSVNQMMANLFRGGRLALEGANRIDWGKMLPGAGLLGGVGYLSNQKGLVGDLASYALEGPAMSLFSGKSLDTFEEWLHPGSGKQRGLTKQEQEMREAAGAHKNQAQLFRDIAGGLAGGRKDENLEKLGEISSLVGIRPADQMQEKYKAGDISGAQQMLLKAAEEADAKASEENKQAIADRQARIAQLTTEAEKQRQLALAAVDGSHEQKAAEEVLAQKKQEILQLIKERNDYEEKESADFGSRTQEAITLLETEKTLVGEIGELYAQMPGDSHLETTEKQVDALKEQLALLDQAKARIDQNPNIPKDQRDTEVTAIDKQRREILGQIGGLDNPESTRLNQTLDARRVAFSRAHQEGEGYGVGRNEAEKLVNRERALKQELGGLNDKDQAQGGLSDNERVRQLQLEIDLHKNKEAIQTRIVYLKQQEKQIMFDANREFSKSLLFAGPGEMLQKLAALKLGAGGAISAGGFFGMDPSLRHIYDETRGGDAGRTNRAEQRVLAGRGETVEQQQQEAERDARRRAAIARGLGQSTAPQLPAAAAPVAGVASVGREAAIAAAQVNQLGIATVGASAQLGRLSTAIGVILSLVGGPAAAAGQAGVRAGRTRLAAPGSVSSGGVDGAYRGDTGRGPTGEPDTY